MGGQEEGFGGALCIYTGGQDTPGRYMVSSCGREQSQEFRGHSPNSCWGEGSQPQFPLGMLGSQPPTHHDGVDDVVVVVPQCPHSLGP